MVLDLLVSTEVIADAPQQYMPDKTAVIVGHELRALEEVPLEVQWLDKVKSDVTAPRQITDANTQLHVKQASLRPEQRMYWQAHHYPYSILCTHYARAPVFSLRYHLCKMTSGQPSNTHHY